MRYLLFCLLLVFASTVDAQSTEPKIVFTDLENYWKAYDLIVGTSDSLKRLELIQALYIDRGTEGLHALKDARRYRADEWVDNMLKYPNYWNSIRANTSNLVNDTGQIALYLRKLKEVYPALKPATFYFAVGAFRSGGTYHGDKVLFGSEFMLAQKSAKLEELPEQLRKTILAYAPYDVPLTAVHEYIHTQQKRWENQSILHLCVAEGVAEFVSTLITQKPLSPAVQFGKQHPEEVLNRFMVEILRDNDVWNWLWSENRNELKVNDLGYYIGYEICERYYQQATDKKQAIKDLISLDYENEAAFARLVDGSKFLPLSVQDIERRYEQMRPTVKRILELEKGNQNISSSLKTITVEFSEPMSPCCRSVDFDESDGITPLRIKKHIGWSADAMRYTFEVEDLKPNTSYGLIISNFAKADGGNRLAPYTIRFRTR